MITLPRTFVAPNAVAKVCPSCGAELGRSTPLAAEARALGLCGRCNAPFWEEERTCRPLTAAERAEPEIRRALAVARGNLNRHRRARAAEQAAELGLLAAPVAQGLDRPTVSGLRRRLMSTDDTTDHKPLVMTLLAEVLIIDGDCIRYQPGCSDVTVAASATKRFATTVREVMRDRKLRMSSRQLAQALKDATVTAGLVAEARGLLCLPLRDPVEPEVLQTVGQQTKAMAAQMTALRAELAARLATLLGPMNAWTERNECHLQHAPTDAG